jgi:tetratricopeptide (TPR) repeat protein
MKSRDPKGVAPARWQSGKERRFLIAFGLCLLTLTVYSNSFGAGFTMDNRGLILQDARVHSATAENLGLIVHHTYWWPYGESGLFRPFTTLTYLFNYAILGDAESPAGYHWINFLLHAANVLLLYALASRFVAGWRPVWIAAVWAVLPVLTESVTNIVGRADLLAGLAVLGGVLLYLKATDAEGRARWAYFAALSITTAVGVFSKESAVMLLPIVVLYEAVLWRERRQAIGLLYGVIAMLIPIQAMLYQRGAVLWSSLPTNFPFYDNPIVGAGWLTGRLTALTVVGKYLGLLIWPAQLSCDYSWSQIPLGVGWAGWIWLIIAAGVIALLRHNRTGLFVAGAGLLIFLPTSNLLFPIGTIMAERFLYLPSIAFAAAVVGAVFWAAPRVRAPWFVHGILGFLVLAYAARTWARNVDWQDDLSIGKSAVASAPESFKSHKLLAYALHESDARGNIDRVIEEAEKGLAPLNPLPDLRNNADSYLRTAGYYSERGDLMKPSNSSASQAAYRRALDLLLRCRTIATAQLTGPADPARFAGLALRISEAYRNLGEPAQALEAAIEGRGTEPANLEVHHQIAAMLIEQGRADEAAAALMEGVLVTADTGLRNELLRLYQGGLDRAGCATMPIQGNTALNPNCEIVHRHLCEASAGTIRLRLQTARPDLAETMKETALKEFHCNPDALGTPGVR